MEKRAVVYTVDGDMGCVLQMEDSVRSVRAFLGDIDIVVCTNAPGAAFDLKYGQRVVDVSGIVSAFGLDRTGVAWRGRPVSPMLLFRLAIPLVPELAAYDKVLYLDCDTEVWDPGAARIFDFDTEGHELTAVRDGLGNSRVWGRVNKVMRSWPTDDFPFHQRWDYLLATKAYVNSGVIVFDMKRLSPGYGERFAAIVEQLARRKPPYPDQDIVNAYFDIFLVMDRSFNNWSADAEGCLVRHNVGGVRRATRFYPPEHGRRPVDALVKIAPKASAGALSGRVDRVAVLSDRRDPGRAARFARDLSELWGVAPDETVWYSPDVFTVHALRDVPSERGLTPDYLALWRAHYVAVRSAYDAGSDHLAVFEDTWDVRGMARAEAERLSGALPVEYSLAAWDAKVPSGFEGDWFCLHWDGEDAAGASSKLYMMDRKCMKTYLWLFESLLDENTPFRKLRMAHHWFNDSLRGKQRLFFRKDKRQ